MKEVRMEENGQRDYAVKALETGVRVMMGLGLPEYVELSLKDLAESMGLSVNKTFRILQTLKRHQWVEEVDGRWRIAPAFTQFSDAFRKYLGKKIGEIERLKLEHLGN
jgi:DNA-binding IclR family transcriptional regulator